MKIHGTAKGGAVGKKDFGVAFGGGAVEPINDENLAAYYKFNETLPDAVPSEFPCLKVNEVRV